jgi:hypothetical protein
VLDIVETDTSDNRYIRGLQNITDGLDVNLLSLDEF